MTVKEKTPEEISESMLGGTEAAAVVAGIVNLLAKNNIHVKTGVEACLAVAAFGIKDLGLKRPWIDQKLDSYLLRAHSMDK